MQRRQTAAGAQREREARRAQGRVDARPAVGHEALLVHQPARVGQHQRKEIGRPAKQKNKESRHPCPNRPDPVRHGVCAGRFRNPAGVRKPGILDVEGQQGQDENEGQRTEHAQGSLTQARDTAVDNFIADLGFLPTVASANSRPLMMFTS